MWVKELKIESNKAWRKNDFIIDTEEVALLSLEKIEMN